MSASNKKKLRKQEAESQMTERQQAASKEAKKQKNATLTFWVVIALCVCITIGSLLTNPVKNVVYRNTEAVQVGDYTLNAVELNYFYVDAVSQFYQSYKNYISYMLNTKAPLDEQVHNKETGETWADYFLDAAFNNIQSTYAVYNLAVSEGYTLDEDAKADLENAMFYISFYASYGGYSNVDSYLAAMYGNGATEESYRAYLEKCRIAESYYQDYSEGLEYTADELTAYHKDHTGEFFSYSYASYYLSIKSFYAEGAGKKDDKGNMTYTDEETEAAIKAAKEAADSLAAGNFADLDAFEQAIKDLPINQKKEEDKKPEDDKTEDDKTEDDKTEDDKTEDDKTEDDKTEDDKTEDKEEEKTYKYLSNQEDILFSKVNSLFRDWIIGKVDEEGEEEEDEEKEPVFETRNEGDMKVFESSTGEDEDKVVNGFYVVRYGSVNVNDYVLKNVRHILVKFEQLKADGTVDTNSKDKEFSESEKKASKDEADKLLQEWLDGDATEDTFAELAKKKTDDTASASAGGLYENIYRGQMVEAFEDWCYDETRKEGDYAIVETEYGYHIMYFVSSTEYTYCEHLITESMRAEDTAEWYEALVEALKVTEITDKYVLKDMTMA